MKTFAIISVLLAALAIGGCTSVGQTVAHKVAEPVLGLAVEDAVSTLMWIESQVADSQISAIDAELAMACPKAVLSLHTLRMSMEEAEAPDGFKGLIYFGTIKKYGGTERDMVVRGVTETAATCLPLLPYTKLRDLF